MGRILSVNLSRKKGTIKKPAACIELVPGLGVKDDAHAAPGDRQVSLLMQESIERQKALLQKAGGDRCEATGQDVVELSPGAFAENLTTTGIDLLALRLGDRLRAGQTVLLRVSKIGKECHQKCAIYYRVGECVMPREGIFCEVLEGGVLAPGDALEKV